MSDTLGMLRRCIAGSPIKVTYFKQGQDTSETASTDAQGVEMQVLDKVHTCTLLIHNFELILPAPITFEYDANDVLTKYTGEAFTYPGFRPSQGDLFIYELADGQAGLFSISSAPERLSIRSSTYHKIQFELENILTAENINQCMDSVSEEAYFDLERFLTQEGALLKSDEYALMKKIEEWYVTLSRYYLDTFFDKLDWNTLIRPDKIYDPYIVEFVRYILSYEMMPHRPQQHIHDLKFWHRSIWWRLLYPSQVTNALLINNQALEKCRIQYMTTTITPLANRNYIILCNDNSHGFVDYTNMIFGETNTFRTMINQFFTSQVIDTTSLITQIESFDTLSTTEQFYRIPVFIAFMNKITASLKSGKNIVSSIPAL